MNDTDTKTEAVNEDVITGEIGDLFFRDVLVQFMALLDEVEEEKFTQYITEHIDDETFLDDLCAAYPAFAELLASELQIIEAELADAANSLE